VIELDRLTYTYPRALKPALTSVSLQIEAGETVLLTGRSGSGKSTLLGTINGLVPHFYGGRFAGRALIAGHDTRSFRPYDLAGFVGTAFQEPGTRFVTRSVSDELAFGLEAEGRPGDEIRERVRATTERLSLGHLTDRPLDQLSGGEQQRVAVAAALMREPRVLVLDEPTSQLDADGARGVLDWLRDLCRDSRLTTVISEHRLTRLLPEADRVAALGENGVLDGWGVPDDVVPRLAYGPPLIEAARRLGLRADLSDDSKEQLHRALLHLEEPRQRPTTGDRRLVCRGVSFAYPAGFALSEVSFEVRQGEAIVVLGGNGSGKTTLLRCVMGLLTHKGEVEVDGRAVERLPVAERANWIAYLPQWPSAFLFAETVQEELLTTLRYRGLEPDPEHDPQAMLEVFGLAALADRYPRDLAAGEKQRTALAAVMIAGTQTLLLDEPTLGMDPLTQVDLVRRIQGWKQAGLSVIVATHDVEFAAAVADRAVVLDAGRVAAEGATGDVLFSQPGLRTALQNLSGRAWPACVSDLDVKEDGGGNADY
jgi:energy-coupling factor transporter ATP-binding protein EcfA2